MDETKKNDAPKPAGGTGVRPGAGSGPAGSGSDTASAAKISAGTSLGSTGQSPRPPGMGGGQSSTLASHSSRPLGGSPGGGSSAGAGAGSSSGAGQRPQASSASGGDDKGASETFNAAAEQARQTAQAAGETLRDVAGDVGERAGEAYEQASEWAREKYDQASSWASEQYDQYGSRYVGESGRYVRRAGTGVERFVSENPVLVGVIGLAAGLLLGALLPRTRQEDRTLGRWSDEVRDQGMRYARDMTQRGREYVSEVLSDEDARFASPGGQESGRDQGQRPSPQRPGPSGRVQNH